MGDRFYEAQGANKSTVFTKERKRLKADIINDVLKILGSDINGLEKLTVKTLKELEDVLCKNLT